MLRKAQRLLALLLGPALLIVCSQSFAEEVERWGVNLPQGVTPVSRDIYGLHMDIFWWCVAIGVVVYGIMFYSMLVHRKSQGAKAKNFHESTTLEIVWTIIPFAILILMAVPATSTLVDMYDTEEADMDVLITGYQWKWNYKYIDQDVAFFSNLTTPVDQIYNREPKGVNYLLEVDEPLVVPIKKKIRLLITAADVIHSWWVPELAVKQDAIPGFISETWTYIEEPGTYRGQCAELCGKDHGFMPIVVKALPEEEYQNWLAAKKVEAEKVKALTNKVFTFDELYTKGEAVYAKACAVCHGPAGEGIAGAFPALKGSTIATGVMIDHLRVVVDGVPNTAMQAFGEQLSEADIAAVITFERNAWGNNMGDQIQPIDVLKYKQREN